MKVLYLVVGDIVWLGWHNWRVSIWKRDPVRDAAAPYKWVLRVGPLWVRRKL